MENKGGKRTKKSLDLVSHELTAHRIVSCSLFLFRHALLSLLAGSVIVLLTCGDGSHYTSDRFRFHLAQLKFHAACH